MFHKDLSWMVSVTGRGWMQMVVIALNWGSSFSSATYSTLCAILFERTLIPPFPRASLDVDLVTPAVDMHNESSSVAMSGTSSCRF